MTEYAVFQQSGTDSAERVRLSIGGLFPQSDDLRARSGLLDDGGALALAGGMDVTVSPFRALIQGTSGTTQGAYLSVLDAEKTLTFTDGGASNRTDIVVGRVYDNAYDASGMTKFSVEIVEGTPGAGTPATPSNAVLLGEKVITAGMSAGTGGLGTAPTDKRPPRLVANGGLVPVVDAADRATLRAFKGLSVYRLDSGDIEVYNGAAWDLFSPVGDTGWTTLAAPAGNWQQSSGRPVRVRAKNGLVQLVGGGQRNTSTFANDGSFETLWTLAAEYRPPADLFGYVVPKGGGDPDPAPRLVVKVQATGEVSLSNVGSDTLNSSGVFDLNLAWFLD